jgi:hypothetical protein
MPSQITPEERARFYKIFTARTLCSKIGILRDFFDRKRKALEALWTERLSSQQPPDIIPVPRVRNISPEDFQRNYLRPAKPVVLEGFCASWPAMQGWRFEALEKNYGEFEHPISSKRHGQVTEKAPLRNVLQSFLQAKEDRYISFGALLSYAPELTAQLDQKAMRELAGLNPGTTFLTKLFAGQKGRCSSFHTDIAHNFLAQIEGEKTMALFEDSETPLLYPKAGFFSPGDYGAVSLISKDALFTMKFENYPLSRFARRMEASLHPGDVLFLPAFVWHQARYHTAALSAANWWPDLFNHIHSNPLFSALGAERYWQGYRRILSHKKKEGYLNRNATLP